MNQPIPKVSDADIRRIAIRDFGQALLPEVMAVLQEYGRQEWNRPGSPRVLLAVLKLANGSVERLREHTRKAVDDFRDVVAMAEYPRYTEEIGFDSVSGELERSVIKDDWKQYREWLEKE